MKEFTLNVVRWQGHIHCVYLNDYRICGDKPWGGGKIEQTFNVSLDEIAHVLKSAGYIITKKQKRKNNKIKGTI